LETLVGGNITLFEEMCETTREQALELMMQHAMARGANAVIGVRYDSNELMQGVTEVLVYGTAVVVEKAHPRRERKRQKPDYIARVRLRRRKALRVRR
jgi:uncharacterized protein YbjQ (UPF0145 family)